jgi:hypothetical protein
MLYPGGAERPGTRVGAAITGQHARDVRAMATRVVTGKGLINLWRKRCARRSGWDSISTVPKGDPGFDRLNDRLAGNYRFPVNERHRHFAAVRAATRYPRTSLGSPNCTENM